MSRPPCLAAAVSANCLVNLSPAMVLGRLGGFSIPPVVALGAKSRSILPWKILPRRIAQQTPHGLLPSLTLSGCPTHPSATPRKIRLLATNLLQGAIPGLQLVTSGDGDGSSWAVP